MADVKYSSWPFGAARSHPVYWAFIVHRLSGVLLALFLPVHFWTLSLAIQGEAALDSFLVWSEAPWVKAGEIGLVILLAAHMMGGVRLLAVKFLPWRDWQKTLVALVFGISLAVGLAMLMNML